MAFSEESSTRVTPVHVSWILGNAETFDVKRGRTILLDKIGSDSAYKLACDGKVLHVVDIHVQCQRR